MKKIIQVVVTVVLLGGITAGIGVTLANNKKKMEHEAKLSQVTAKSIPVVVYKAKTVKIGKDFEISGTFEPVREMRFSADVQGKALQVLVEKGQQIYEGQLLVKLDDQDLQRDLKLAKVNYDQAKKDLARFTALKAGEGITAQQLEQTRLQYRVAEIRIEKIQAQINKMHIKAPIAGVITQKFIEKGSFVSPGTPLVEITDIHQLKMVVKLAENEAVQVKKGQAVTVKANVYANKVHQGRISTIAVKADISKRYDVEIDVNNSGQDMIRAGMQGTANFKFDKIAEVLVIPRKAIVGSLQDAKVYITTADHKAQLIKIETGITHQHLVQVTKGLSVGDQVITSGQINLQNGTKVSVLK